MCWRLQMDDRRDKELVCTVLRDAGLTASLVPVDPRVGVQRCDLSAHDNDQDYFVEVKTINDDDEIRQTLRRGEVYETDSPIVYRKRVAKEIHSAMKQLRSTAGEHKDHLWLVVLIARSHDVHSASEQILGTLYGVGAIVDRKTSDHRRCLYFSESAFHKYPGLDGAIVIDGGAALHLNDYGPRLDRARQSQLARFFAQHGALYDKETMESRVDCLTADFEMDRADEHAVLEQLKAKYRNPNLQLMHWHHCEAIWTLFPASR
jgi:hypothetical protein